MQRRRRDTRRRIPAPISAAHSPAGVWGVPHLLAVRNLEIEHITGYHVDAAILQVFELLCADQGVRLPLSQHVWSLFSGQASHGVYWGLAFMYSWVAS